MTLDGSRDSRLRLASGVMMFVILSLWLEVNSDFDRVIQRAVGGVGAFASQALDYFIDLMLQSPAIL